MKAWIVFGFTCLLLAGCVAAPPPVPISELPDPAIYALTYTDLPEVGMTWRQTYNQASSEEGYKRAYLAYEAYQPGNLGVDLESGFAVNNDVTLYTSDVSREELPKPPASIGDIEDIDWKMVSQSRELGDRSAVWKATLGENRTPAWWLEFYQGHSYVRISLLGFPDQIAPAILYGMGEIVSSRLPLTVEELRSDTSTQPAAPSVQDEPGLVQPPTQAAGTLPTLPQVMPSTYTAPAGETGMVTFFDDNGMQLSDGVNGNDDILADQGQGTAYEWVGWTDVTEPVTLTFSFEGPVAIESVAIGVNHREGLGIFPPARVQINGVSFEAGTQVIADNQRGDLVFEGAFSGPTVEVVLYHQGRGWILVDEIRFFSQQ